MKPPARPPLNTGQHSCHDPEGQPIPCPGSGQDGDFIAGQPWPEPRFAVIGEQVEDRLTGLLWPLNANPGDFPLDWQEALAYVDELNASRYLGENDWRLPSINELESLVDCAHHSPALPAQHPFSQLREIYWSASTSLYEADWAWALYLDKGAVGVGQKRFARFHVWAVADAE